MAAIDLRTLGEAEMKKFIDSFDTVLTDCDGVLWFHTSALPNAADAINTFRDLGKKVFYVTNNSTKTREEFSEKCEVLNFIATPEDILCTAYLTARYLRDINFTKKAYVIGSSDDNFSGITKELDYVGIPHIGIGPDPVLNSPYEAFEMDPEVGAVIVGFDEHFSYRKMMKAASYLKDKNVHFIATNTDERFPTSGSLVIPGTGSLVRCIETCSERKAVVMGKPETYVADMLAKHHKIEPQRTLMIGDRANTDILLGTRCGFQTLLVLSGVTTLEEIEHWRKSDVPEDRDYLPTYYTEQLGDLLPHLHQYKVNQQKS